MSIGIIIIRFRLFDNPKVFDPNGFNIQENLRSTNQDVQR